MGTFALLFLLHQLRPSQLHLILGLLDGFIVPPSFCDLDLTIGEQVAAHIVEVGEVVLHVAKLVFEG